MGSHHGADGGRGLVARLRAGAAFLATLTALAWTGIAFADGIAVNTIETVAGTGGLWGGFSGDGGPATAAKLNDPRRLAVDRQGNLYIADTLNRRIRRVAIDGTITTIAGSSGPFVTGEGDGGPATAATFQEPAGVAVDADGNVYVADAGRGRVRRVGTDGVIRAFAGGGSLHADGVPATSVRMVYPRSMAIDAAGNVYITDNGAHRVRRVDPNGIITTVAGTGVAGFSGDGGPAAMARLDTPIGVAVDGAGCVYIADLENQRVRKVDASGRITTFAGGGAPGFSGDGGPALGAGLARPFGLTIDRWGALYVAEEGSSRVRRIGTDGNIVTVAGTTPVVGPSGGDGGEATWATLHEPIGVALDGSGDLYIADRGWNRVLRVRFGRLVSTVAGDGSAATGGDGGPATAAGVGSAMGVTVDGTGGLYIAQYDQNRVRRVAPDGSISTFAGTGTAGFSGDDGPATAAKLRSPFSTAIDPAGGLLIADSWNHRVRRVGADGIIRTVAGNGVAGFSGEGVQATAASFNAPAFVLPDGTGGMYVADYSNHRVRRIDASGVVTTIAGNGTAAFSGDGGPATAAGIGAPSGLALDAAGNLYVADRFNARVRRIGTDGMITTFAGSGAEEHSGDGGPATAAGIGTPFGLAIDRAGILYVADTTNDRIRRVGTDGIIGTFAGNGVEAFAGDGGVATEASFSAPYGVAVDSQGTVFVADPVDHRVRRLAPQPLVPPTANAGPDQRLHVGTPLVLDGTGSSDDNTETADLLFRWNWSGPAGATLSGPNTATPTFTAAEPGEYTLKLTVTDEDGLVGDPDEVVISTYNLAPTANAGPDRVGVVGVVGVVVTFTGSGTDPEGDPLTYAWTLTSKPMASRVSLQDASTATPSLTPDLAGPYRLSLIVHDGYQGSRLDGVLLTVGNVTDYTSSRLSDASATVTSMQKSAFSSDGHQEQMANLIAQASDTVQRIDARDADALRTTEAARATDTAQAADLTLAVSQIRKLMERTDGWVLRGRPDPKGAGSNLEPADWIEGRDAQIELYAILADALDVLTSR